MSYLTQSAENSSIIKYSKSLKNASENYAPLVENIHTCLNQHLMILMNQMLNTAGDVLFNLSEKADLDNKQMFFLDIIQLINKHQSTIKQQFFICLNESLHSNKACQLGENNEPDLSLIEQDEMEEMVVIMTMHSQATSQFGETINHLEARLEYLEINNVNIFEKDAIDPRHLCEVFRDTIDSLDLEIDVKLVLYRLYNNEINIKLENLYKALNELFIDAKVLPTIVLNTSKPEEYAEEDKSTVQSLRVPGEKYIEDEGYITKNQSSDNENASMYNNAKQLVSQFLSGEVIQQGDGIPKSFTKTVSARCDNDKNFYPRDEVMKTLSRLQHSLLNDISDNDDICAHRTMNNQLIDPEAIKQELLSDIGRQHGGIVDRQVHLLDERSIDFVGMMFKEITTDDSISSAISNLILRLQIPVIKVAMLDTNLFKEENHPTKQVLNLVSDAGKGVTDEQDRVYGDIENIVDTVVENFEVELDVFYDAVDSLVSLIEAEEALVYETEQAEQRNIVQLHARDVVVNKLKIFSSRLKLPACIRPLVLKNWSTFMLNNYIKYGKESCEWLHSVMLMKLLLRCLQPINNNTQYNLVKNNFRDLVAIIESELYATKQDRTDIDVQVFQLQSLFITGLEIFENELEQNKHSQRESFSEMGQRINVSSSEEIKINESEKECSEKEYIELTDENGLDEAARAAQQETEHAKNSIAELGNMARPGDWYKVYNGEDKAVRRLKLSVILTEVAKLIFVDHRGVKVIEKDASDFIEELADKRSALISEHSAFDHALGQVIHRLAA